MFLNQFYSSIGIFYDNVIEEFLSVTGIYPIFSPIWDKTYNFSWFYFQISYFDLYFYCQNGNISYIFPISTVTNYISGKYYNIFPKLKNSKKLSIMIAFGKI